MNVRMQQNKKECVKESKWILLQEAKVNMV